MSEEIIIEVAANGDTKIEANGFEGTACSLATEQIELVLGGQARKTKKPEYYQPTSTAQTINRKL